MAARLVTEMHVAQAIVSDETLVQRLRAGETAVGDELVRRYCQPLMRYLLRLAGAENLAEELHQQIISQDADGL